jgi:DnaJ domain
MNLPGRLRATTLGDLLGTLHRAEATGTLELAEDVGRTHRVYLSVGFVVAVEVDGASPTLGEILRHGHLVRDDLLKRSLLRAISSNRLHGDVLVQDFRVEDGVVRAALRQQIMERLERLDRVTDARVLFRVALRAPRGALTDTPLCASQFLPGKRRARDAVRAADAPSAPPSGARTCSPQRSRDVALRVLGVTSLADEPEIRRAYRRLARAFHPDLHPAASEDERRALVERFQAVTEAYRALVA